MDNDCSGEKLIYGGAVVIRVVWHSLCRHVLVSRQGIPGMQRNSAKDNAADILGGRYNRIYSLLLGVSLRNRAYLTWMEACLS